MQDTAVNLYDDLDTTRKVAAWTAEVTHNHPEGIKGAEATAGAIFMARNHVSKDEIRDYIVSEFGYDLSRTCDEIRPGYHHVESCQETVPEAITAFLEGNDFEDVIRTAVSLGGDCDTLTCIAGSIAEAFYGVPIGMIAECRSRMAEDMKQVMDRFDKAVGRLQRHAEDRQLRKRRTGGCHGGCPSGRRQGKLYQSTRSDCKEGLGAGGICFARPAVSVCF